LILDGSVRVLGETAGSVRTGLNTFSQTTEGPRYAPHCHSAEEEIFVILEGAGVVRLEDDEHPVRAGHAISRRPGTGIPHSFVATVGPFTHLAYGTRDPNDIVFYPESGEVRLCGVGVTLQTR
jgi:uncharacterized cupin superfamily protein